MTIFHTVTIDNQAAVVGANWPLIQSEAARYHRAVVEIREYNPLVEISAQQMKYWYAVPVTEYARIGHTRIEADRYLKRHCGTEWFVLDVEEEQTKRGQNMFECLKCGNLFLVPHKKRGKYVCPAENCGCDNIRLFFMLSKTEVSISIFNDFLENTFAFMKSINRPIRPPDKNWRINKE